MLRTVNTPVPGCLRRFAFVVSESTIERWMALDEEMLGKKPVQARMQQHVTARFEDIH